MSESFKTPTKAKDPIILNADGSQVGKTTHGFSKLQVFKIGGPLALVVLPLVATFTIAISLLTLLFVIPLWILKSRKGSIRHTFFRYRA